jgi:hypothetical protein
MKGKSNFFFEKKKQKTFIRYGQHQCTLCGLEPGGKEQKFFGSFFQKRTLLLKRR